MQLLNWKNIVTRETGIKKQEVSRDQYLIRKRKQTRESAYRYNDGWGGLEVRGVGWHHEIKMSERQSGESVFTHLAVNSIGRAE